MAFVNIDEIRERAAKAAGEAGDALEETLADSLSLMIVVLLVVGVIGTFILTDLAGALLMALAYGTIVLGVYFGSRGTEWMN